MTPLEALRLAQTEAEREMARILARLEGVSKEGRLRGDVETLAVVNTVRREAVALLSRYEVVSVNAAQQALVRQAVEASSGIDWTAAARARLDGAIGPVMADAARAFGDGAEAVTRAVIVGTTGARNTSTVIKQAQDALRTTFSRAATAVDTAGMGLARLTVTISQQQASQETGRGDALFLYTGPRGSILRPFCAEHLGKVFTLAELDALDNGPGQPKPVSVYLGGYNCRHRLAPISLERARAQGLR